jgi:hypothetical protein
MNNDSRMKVARQEGAEAIAAKAVAIGMKLQVVVSECIWDIGADFGHEYAHRLDLGTLTNKVRIYFSDLDLRTAEHDPRKDRVEDRLHRAIAQLIARVPSQTYTYR